MRPIRTSLRSFATCAAFAAALMAASPARAEGVTPDAATAAQKKEATDHFNAGKKAYEAKDWPRAVQELRASLNLVNSPNARLQLARALCDSGRLDDAWNEYGRTMDDANVLAAKEERYAKTADAATGERADLEGKIALVTITLQNVPPGATLTVAGRAIAPEQWTSPVAVPAGPADVVVADASGKALARQAVTAVEGQKTPVALDAQPPAPPPPPAAPTTISPEDRPDYVKPQPAAPPSPPAATSGGRESLRPWAYAAGGVGVAGLAAFAVFGALSSSDFNDLKGSCVNGVCPPNKSGEISDGKTFQTVANVGLGVGIVGVAAGATLFVLSLGGRGGQSTGLLVGPGYVGLRGSL